MNTEFLTWTLKTKYFDSFFYLHSDSCNFDDKQRQCKMKIETINKRMTASVRLVSFVYVMCANIASVNIAIAAALLASVSINSKARTYYGKTTQCDRCHGRYQLQCTCKTVIDVCACLSLLLGKLSRHDCRYPPAAPPPLLSFYTNLCCHLLQRLLLLLISVPANGS